MPINLLWIIDLFHENLNRLNIILLRTMGVVPMDIHPVGERLPFNLGIALDM